MTLSHRAITALMVSTCLSTTVAAQGPSLFPPTPVNYGVGAGFAPRSVAIGDLNHDGNPDLVTVNQPPYFSVLLGTGTGTLGAATKFPFGGSLSAVVIGEVNGDNAPDIVIANYNWSSVDVLWGDGMGSYSGWVDLGTSIRPTSIAIGDLNADGVSDLVVASTDGSLVEVLFGDGTGYFNGGPVYSVSDPSLPLATWPVASIAIADVNNDGRNDIVASGTDMTPKPWGMPAGFISILHGAAAPGSFEAPAVTLLQSSQALAIGDLNGDGRADAVATTLQDSVRVLFGTGTGSFGASTEYQVGGSPTSVAIGDLDGDGKLDIATAKTNNTVSVLLGGSGGTFGTPMVFGTGSAPATIAISDLNRDGRLDLVTANLSSKDVSVLLNALPGIAGVASYGTGTSGCAGQLGMNTNLAPTVGNSSFALIGSNAPHNALGFALASDVQDIPGSNLLGVLIHMGLVGADVHSLNIWSGPSGEQFTPVPIPNNPSIVGKSYYFQSFWVEPAGQQCTPGFAGLESSRGLAVTFQP